MSWKRIVGIIVLVVTMSLAIVIDKGVSGLVGFWNLPSLVLPLVVVICLLVVADSFGDFIRGFKIANSIGEHTMKELKTSKNSFDLAARLISISSVIMFLIGGINILGSDKPIFLANGSVDAQATVALAILSLTILYGLIGLMIIYTVRAKIIKEIIYREN